MKKRKKMRIKSMVPLGVPASIALDVGQRRSQVFTSDVRFTWGQEVQGLEAKAYETIAEAIGPDVFQQIKRGNKLHMTRAACCRADNELVSAPFTFAGARAARPPQPPRS
ncbi:hypothetical protein EVAR_49639_1 [Eumeta japonica]|uniref:Uncharacterized protein n=1 Tax=Eumeta variegata TaxID=151549 RepID=A0A4C1YAW3_EUMVA|nr:hypothetical protein EVAR_49639_1 [Eumeta japonica]